MKKTFQILEFDKIIEKLKEYSYTNQAKERFDGIDLSLYEAELQARMKETTEARKILDHMGTPKYRIYERNRKNFRYFR